MLALRTLLGLVLALTFVAGAMAQGGRSEAMSPFDEVQWVGEGEPVAGPMEVRVRVGEAWYVLEAINGLATADLLAGIERHYGRRDVPRRFEEDLIEAMGKLGVERGEVAVLRVREVAGGEAREIRAEWSREKRQALRDAGRQRDSRPRETPLTAADVAAVLDEFEALIERRSAYAAAGGNAAAWKARLAEARARAAEITTRSLLTREVRRVVMAIGDAHASVSGAEVESAAWLPLLPVVLDAESGIVVAARPDRSGFLVEGTPILESIDGVPVRVWLAAAAEGVARAAPHLVAERACRELRDIERLRPAVSPASVGRGEVALGLASASGDIKRTVTLALSRTKPMYGDWPERESGLLELGPAGTVAYIRLGEMNSDSAAAMMSSLREFAAKEMQMVIIDVRGNGGGTRDALFALAGALLPRDADPVVINAARPLLVEGAVPEDVAAQLRRRGLRPANDPEWSEPERAAIARFAATFVPRQPVPDDRFDGWWYACVSPVRDGPQWHGRIVILQDAACFSATDVFLAAMKELPRVTLMGEPSAGGSGAAREHDLPQRIKVRLSSMVSFQPTGERFDGVGVRPDVIFERDPSDAIDPDRWVRRAADLAQSNR